jgi:hypothetical protein
VVLDVEKTKELNDKIKTAILWRTVRTVLLGGGFHNAGVVAVNGATTPSGKPLLLFRTGITPYPGLPGSCVRSLLDAGDVRHIVNLYGGEMPTADLDADEEKAVESAGGTYFQAREDDPEIASWREAMRDHGNEESRRKAMIAVARLVNDHILRPGGEPPKGNVQVHCGGGMHRTGMVFGVIERCVNGTPEDVVLSRYRFHTGWKSPEDPGGGEQENIDFILGFDCSLLNRP